MLTVLYTQECKSAKHSQHSAKQLAVFCPKQNLIEYGCNSFLKFAAIHQKLLQSESVNGTI